jgi:transcriptional regulator with XRE-family HTH domain
MEAKMEKITYGLGRKKSTVAEKLNELRLDRGMKYTELAKHLGVTRQTVANYCTGRTKSIPSDIIDRLCEIFDISRAYLLTESYVMAPDYYLHVICEHTGLSEEAASNLCISDARFPLNYMLEKTSPAFWSVLNAYFSLAIPREPAFLEIDPISLEVKKHMGDLDDLEYSGKLDGEKFRVDNYQLVESALFSIITGELKSLKKNYWGWFLSQKNADTMESPKERIRNRKKTRKQKGHK